MTTIAYGMESDMAYVAQGSFSIEAESSLTDRYQTTVPETIRRALKLGKRDKIHYTVKPTGEVVMARAEDSGDDPALGPFLDLLARDIEAHPKRLQPISVDLLKRISMLTEGVEYDIDAALPDDDEEHE
jgi:antitoxin PrlF